MEHSNHEAVIVSSHGDGGLMTQQLLQELFMPFFNNDWLAQADDAAFLQHRDEALAFSTDSFVVSPLFFPGGDIGKLAVCGTVNDLVVSGAKPLWLSAAFILPEGLSIKRLTRIVRSMAETARLLELPIVTGDTKVANTGDPENLFINTTGIGAVHPRTYLNASRLEAGDAIIITGTIADHGAAILASRLGLDVEELPASDCAPLCYLLDTLEPFLPRIKMMRDPTRGGVATTLKEIALAAGLDLVLEETVLKINPRVQAIAESLGVDPLYLASEGRALIITSQEDAAGVIEALRLHPQGKESAIIGSVRPGKGNLCLKTNLGGTRMLQMLSGTPLPRIC